MMHPVDQLLSILGFVLSTIGFCAGIMCCQVWVTWLAGSGVMMMVIGQGLDKWREWKREQKKKNRNIYRGGYIR